MIQIKEEPCRIFIFDSELEGQPAKNTCVISMNNGDVFHFSDSAARAFCGWWFAKRDDVFVITVRQVSQVAGRHVYPWDVYIQRANVTWFKAWTAPSAP